MTERLIGYGYTNSSGVAILEYDADGTPLNPTGYTGVGAGKIDIVAELHDDSSVQSEPYTLWDTIKYDNGTTDTNIWTNGWSGVQYDRTTNNYSSLTSGQIYTNFTPNRNFAIDFEVCVKGGRSNWFWYCNQTNVGNFGGCGISTLGLSLDNWYKIHIEFTNTKITITNDNNSTVHEIPVDISTSSQIQYRFNINGSITEIDFKNFKIYYI